MRAHAADPRLDVLTLLGHRLPRTRTPEEAASEVTTALAALDLAATVSAVEFDIAVVISMHVPSTMTPHLSPQMAAGVVGMRIPLDAVESLRQPVRLRRLYYGAADAAETLRRLTTDSALAKALPNAADERTVLAVPVTCRDRVVAVLSVWGPLCTPALGPILEVIAAMLAAAWSTEVQSAIGRFEARALPTPDRELRDIVDSLLTSGGIVSALQPIVRLVNDTVIGYEALARYPPLARIGTPDELFASAASLNMQSAVDLACVSAALRAASNIGEADLFVNVLIGTLVDERGVAALDSAVREARVDPASIVLEFSEREPVPDLALLQRIAAELRARGFRIAVDDAGAGHASMRVIAELRPEFIKVDRSLIQAIDADRARRALVVALLSFSGHIGARVIAEGMLGNPLIIGTNGTFRFSGGILFGAGGAIQNNGTIVFDSPVPANQTLVHNITGSGSVIVDITGGGILVVSSNNTYSGATTLIAGTFQAASATAFSPNSAFTVNSTLDLNGFNNTIGSLSGTGFVLNSGVATATLTVGNDNTSTTFSGVLEDGIAPDGPLQLTKIGAGTLTLTGNNTYTGGTTVSADTCRSATAERVAASWEMSPTMRSWPSIGATL